MANLTLFPGEYYFGNEYATVKTLLGSCIAITMWDSKGKVGGMCHYKLPKRLNDGYAVLDGSYGEDAVLLFVHSLRQFMLKPDDMIVGVFGAGNMFSKIVDTDDSSVGVKNIKMAYRLLKRYGFSISHKSLGGNVSRNVSLNLFNGCVEVRSLFVNTSAKVPSKIPLKDPGYSSCF